MRPSTQRRILVWLADEGLIEDPTGMVTTIIAGAVGTTPSYAGLALSRLEQHGLIERTMHGPRTTSARLTVKGRAEVGREGYVGSVIPRRGVPAGLGMPQLGPISRVAFDPEMARERAMGAA